MRLLVEREKWPSSGDRFMSSSMLLRRKDSFVVSRRGARFFLVTRMGLSSLKGGEHERMCLGAVKKVESVDKLNASFAAGTNSEAQD